LACACGVALSLPGGNLRHEPIALANAPIQALAAQHADLDLNHVQPGGVQNAMADLKLAE
jgi:hypothetical protein